MTNATNTADTATITIHTGHEGHRVTNVWIDGIPLHWTDREVQVGVEALAAGGDAVAAAACCAIGDCWIDLTLDGGRVYLDNA